MNIKGIEKRLASHFAQILIENYCEPYRINRKVWYRVDTKFESVEDRDDVENAIKYLDYIGALRRHEVRTNMVRVGRD